MKAVSLVIVLTFLSLPAMAAPPKPVITGGWQSTKIDKDVRAV